MIVSTHEHIIPRVLRSDPTLNMNWRVPQIFLQIEDNETEFYAKMLNDKYKNFLLSEK